METMLEPRFGADVPGNADREHIKLVESAALTADASFAAPTDDGDGDDAAPPPDGSITLCMRLNPDDGAGREYRD